jgi:adenylate cyclase
MPGPDGVVAGDDVLAPALLKERLRSARLFNRYRFLGVTVFLAFSAFTSFVLGLSEWEPDWRVFLAYWLVAGGIWWAGRRSTTFATFAGLAIALIDMPAVTALQWGALRLADPGFIFGSNAALLVLLIIGSMATLDVREVRFATAIAIMLQTALGLRIGWIVPTIVFADLMMLFAVAGCTYLIGRITTLVSEATAEQARRERLGRYFSPEVAAMVSQATADASVGESREVTILFGDLRDFTALSERLSAPQVVALLSAYHERMVRTIFAAGGTLDKFLGDGLMVYFGAPVMHADHAARAVRCALAMQDELRRWNAERGTRGEPALAMGIGIHTGPVVVGNIGTSQRREYTVVGDAVNVAARLQELTRTVGVPILVSEATRSAAGDRVQMVPAGVQQVRGRTQPIDVHRVVGAT